MSAGAELRQELAERAERYGEALDAAGIGLALVQQNADKYYLAGTVQQGVLAVAPGRESPGSRRRCPSTSCT